MLVMSAESMLLLCFRAGRGGGLYVPKIEQERPQAFGTSALMRHYNDHVAFGVTLL